MHHKRFIFCNKETKQWFRSNIEDVVSGFFLFKSYAMAFGTVDVQSFDNDRQGLQDDGWTEIPSPQFYHVTLYYMKESGKYYSSGEQLVNRIEADNDPAGSWMAVMDMIRYKLDTGNLPGLVKGSRFEVFTTGDDHPGAYPACFRINN